MNFSDLEADKEKFAKEIKTINFKRKAIEEDILDEIKNMEDNIKFYIQNLTENIQQFVSDEETIFQNIMNDSTEVLEQFDENINELRRISTALFGFQNKTQKLISLVTPPNKNYITSEISNKNIEDDN